MKNFDIGQQTNAALPGSCDQRAASPAAGERYEPRNDTPPGSASGTPQGDAATASRSVRERIIRWVEEVYTTGILERSYSGRGFRVCSALRGVDAYVDAGLISQADVSEIFVQVAAQRNGPHRW